MNKIIITGRLVRDPEVRYAQATSTAICRYTLAVDRRFKKEGEPEADFFNCTVFGKSAEFAEKYFKQGTKILVVGRVQNNNYTNREGQKVHNVQILVEEQELAESKSSFASARPNNSSAVDAFLSVPDSIDDLQFD